MACVIVWLQWAPPKTCSDWLTDYSDTLQVQTVCLTLLRHARHCSQPRINHQQHKVHVEIPHRPESNLLTEPSFVHISENVTLETASLQHQTSAFTYKDSQAHRKYWIDSSGSAGAAALSFALSMAASDAPGASTLLVVETADTTAGSRYSTTPGSGKSDTKHGLLHGDHLSNICLRKNRT